MKRNHLFTIAMFVVIFIAGGVITHATTTNQKVNGCVNKKSGTLRVVKSGVKCSNAEYAIQWNQKGETGAKGLQGPKGNTGAKGS